MTGHQQIIRARMNGWKPSAVWIEAGTEPMPILSRWDEPEKALDYGFYPTVHIPADELGRKMDLRFLSGLNVHVHAEALTDRVFRLLDAISGLCGHLVAIGENEMVMFFDGEWSAWTF